jgi:3-hydroxyacyl-CoA dehydrogenase
MQHPDRVVGVHWFAPPYLIPTVEILRGDDTPQEAIDFAVELMQRVDKVPAVVKDIPGFILNRFQHVLITTALEIVEEGGVTFEDVDNAMRYGLAPRFPLWGIFGTHDRGVHKRTSSQAGAYISAATGNPKYGPHPLFLKAVEEGRFGIMAGKGWYDYSGQNLDDIQKQKDRELIRMIKLLRENEIL